MDGRFEAVEFSQVRTLQDGRRRAFGQLVSRGASNLESFEISYCAIEDEGVSALCEMNLEGVRQLRFANVEISMLGGADVSRTLGSV